jgi:osmotically-inducible protein OsmY
MTLEGEVEHIVAKKVALERAAQIAGVDAIIDRLRIDPGKRLGDGAVRDHALTLLSQEATLQQLAVEAEVEDGVVTLNGVVPSLSHKRMAGVLAWWSQGRRDVINGLDVDPPQEDNDDELADAVRLVLEKDPFINASQIRIGARDCRVSLSGYVINATERDMAEFDAWYVFGVDDVMNRLEVA